MPTEYGSRNNKSMHTREVVRYNERGGDRFPGKREWARVSSASNPSVESNRAPLLSSFTGGSYEPPAKRRPSARHGFTGENGRCSSREHPRLPEHQPGMFNGGYSIFAHTKVERYAPPPPPPGAMNHFNHHYPPRNGLLRDSLPEDDYYRDREAELPGYQPLHAYSTFGDSGSSSSFPENHHRGSRYPWPEGGRDHHRERLSGSPEVFDRKVGISRYGGEREIEGRHDRYGGGREPGLAEFRGDARSLESQEELGDPFVSSRLRSSSLPREEPSSASPRKKTRLTWGDGLASYEQKHTCKVKVEDEPGSESPFASPPVVADSNGEAKDVKAEIASPSPIREPTPVRDVSPEVVEMEPETLKPAEELVLEHPASPPPGVVEPVAEPQQEPEAATEPEETGEKVTKEELLLQVEQVEFEIDSIEKELARLAVEVASDAGMDEQLLQQQQQLEQQPEHKQQAAEQSEPFDQADPEAEREEESPEPMKLDHQEDALAPNEEPLPEIPERILLEFAHLLPENVRGKRLYSCPQEAAVWDRNENLHQANKARIMERMLEKKSTAKLQEKSLVLKYRILREFTKNEGRKSELAICWNGGESGFKDPLLMKKVLSEPLCPYRDSLRMPSMILNSSEKTVQHIITSNRLVEDPIACEQERKVINPWTAEERKVFVEKFAVFYKNFAKIASFLPYKTTGDCVEFYYRNQKSEDLIKLRKKQKKRHYRTSYLATTGTGGRLRDPGAAAIQKLASAATLASSNFGRLSRNHMKERLTLSSDCVTADAAGRESRSANFSGIVTGACSLSSDAPLTPSRASCERGFSREEQCGKQKGARSSRGRREHGGDEVELEWSDTERELFLDALLMFGKDFKSIALHLRSRSESQCKTFFSKARKRLKLDRIVEHHRMAQVAPVVEQQQQQQMMKVVAVVNRACEDPGGGAEEQEQDRLENAVDRYHDSEEMDVSVVVDSGVKESNEVADPESNTEGLSAAPGGGGTGGALVDSPGSSVITSPGLVSSSGNAPEGDLSHKPLMTESYRAAPPKRKVEEWSQQMQPPGVLQALYPPQLQVPPVVLSEQQQLMILQHHKQLLRQLQPQLAEEQILRQQQQQSMQFLPQKLLPFPQAAMLPQQQEQAQKQAQQQHLLNLLTQQQQLALQLHQPGSFSQQQKVPGLQMLERSQGKFLTGGEIGDSIQRRVEEPRGVSSDVKLFGKSLLSQPVKSSGVPSSIPFLLGESWCSGSAEAQDRGVYSMSGGLPESSKANGSCSREAMNLWQMELMKSASYQQQQLHHQQQQQQQQGVMIQQQGLKDGVMYPGQVLQFAGGGNWGASSANASQQARILAQLTLAEQQRQSLS